MCFSNLKNQNSLIIHGVIIQNKFNICHMKIKEMKTTLEQGVSQGSAGLPWVEHSLEPPPSVSGVPRTGVLISWHC